MSGPAKAARAFGRHDVKKETGAGARAGSCDDLTVLEDQITIVEQDQKPRESLGEAERQLSFCARRSHEPTAGEM